LKKKLDKFNRTPLQWAALGGNVECAEVLIKNGADMYAQTNSQTTVLHAACEGGHTKFVAFILEHCEDRKLEFFSAENNDGKTPFALASEVQGKVSVKNIIFFVSFYIKYHFFV
jgi:ankyrin repeat protein